MTTKAKLNAQIVGTIILTNPKFHPALYGEYLDLINDVKFLVWLEDDLEKADKGLNWSLETFEQDKDVDLTVKYLARRLMDLYNGIPYVAPEPEQAEAAPVKAVVSKEAVQKKKASKGLPATIFSLISGLFQKFMGLSNVGKVVVLILIFAILSQLGGPKNPPTEEGAQTDVAVATEPPLDPFAAIDEENAKSTPAVANPIDDTTVTFEQIKQELINKVTTINYCSPIEAGQTVGQATARSGSSIDDDEDAPINNGTSVTILDVVKSNFYDFKGKAGCGSNLRVKVKTSTGQVSWVHGSTVEGVAK